MIQRVMLMAAACAAATACSSFSRGRNAYPQTYLSAEHNWAFKSRYPGAAGLLNGFDFGHAILYETLVTKGASPDLDGATFRHVTEDVLRHPPSVPLEERAIGPSYATLIPEVIAIFDWAHMLHRQLYDILSDERIAPDTRVAFARRVLDYYRSRPDLALSDRPKAMDLMEGQPYSLTFRRAAPRYNALVWSYHWFQMVLYDALLTSASPEDATTRVARAVAHFWEMNTGAATQPTVMPMSPAIAPVFTARFPDAAAIFDNLHSLHDVVSDILASPGMSRAEKRRAALVAAARYRDSDTAIISWDEWRDMSRSMGVDLMGGRLP